jgi:5-methylcytosine-specific restriction endonuclease McrA
MSSLLDTRVLKLNSLYMPFDTMSVRDALCDLFSGVVEAIYVNDAGQYESHDFTSWSQLTEYRVSHEAEWIHTPRLTFPVPRIVRCMDYDDIPVYEPRLTRAGIMERDHNTCQYCNRKFSTKELNIDHVMPRCRGGKNTWTNLVCSCIACNVKKGDKTPSEAGMVLLKKPIKPIRKMKFTLPRNTKTYSGWDKFVSEIYWNTTLSDS